MYKIRTYIIQLKERAVGFVATDCMIEHKVEYQIRFWRYWNHCNLTLNCVWGSVLMAPPSWLAVKVGYKWYWKAHSQTQCICSVTLVLCFTSKYFPLSPHFEVLNSLHHFMTGVNRHALFLEIQKELNPDRPCLELEHSTESIDGDQNQTHCVEF